jgi:hypothetical protein
MVYFNYKKEREVNTMSVCSKEMVEIRVELLKQMHKYIIEMGDEYLYEAWIISAVPDEWIRTCALFGKLSATDIKENY